MVKKSNSETMQGEAQAQLAIVRSTVGIVLKTLAVILAADFFSGTLLRLLGVGQGTIQELAEALLTCTISLPGLYALTLRPVAGLAAERATAAAESRFQAISHCLQDGIIIFDEHRRIRFANRAVERMHGHEPGVLSRKTMDILMPVEEQLAFRIEIANYLQTHQSHVIEKGLAEKVGVRANGEPFPVEIAVSELRGSERPEFIVAVRDITARKKMELALRASEETQRKLAEQQKAILDTLPVAVRIVAGDTIVYANPADARLHGYASPQDEIGVAFTEQLMPEERNRVWDIVRRREAGQTAPSRYRVQRKRADGSEFQAECTVEIIEYEGRKARLIVIEDLTDRERLGLYEKLLPVCCMCGKIRNDEGAGPGKGDWERLDHYVARHSDAQVSHTFCPGCLAEYRKQQGMD